MDAGLNPDDLSSFFSPKPIREIDPQFKANWVTHADLIAHRLDLAVPDGRSAAETVSQRLYPHIAILSLENADLDWSPLDINRLRCPDPEVTSNRVYVGVVLLMSPPDQQREVLQVLLAKKPEAAWSEDYGMRQIKEAFERPERASRSGLHLSAVLHGKILDLHSEYNDVSYLSPCTSIIGPFGVGKSFAIRQLAVAKQMYVTYVSLTARELVFPSRSKLADLLMEPRSYKEQESLWFDFILCSHCDVMACIDVGLPAAQYFDLLTNEVYSSRFCAEFTETLKRRPFASPTGFVGEAALRRITAERSRQIRGLATELGVTLADPPKPTPGLFVLCIEEAQSLRESEVLLPSLLKALRRAHEQSGVYVLGVLLDNIYLPTNLEEPELKLLPPIYNLPSFDAFALVDPPVPDGSSEAAAQIFKYGRPLWGALLESGWSFDEVLSLARQKTHIAGDGNLTRLLALGHRVHFDVTDAALAEKLVSSGLRYPLYVNPDRTWITTTQPSEPVLSQASMQKLANPELRLSALKEFVQALARGSIHVGDAGKVAASFVLQFSMDYAFSRVRKDLAAPQAVPISSFFAALFGDQSAAQISQWVELSNLSSVWTRGKVFFNHIFDYADLGDLKVAIRQAFSRGTAISAPSIMGTDLLIPIQLTGEASATAPATASLDAETNATGANRSTPPHVGTDPSFSCLLIHIVNHPAQTHSQLLSSGSFGLHMTTESLKVHGLNLTKTPHLGLVMSLHCTSSKKKLFRVTSNPGQRLVVGAHGLGPDTYPRLFPRDQAKGIGEFYRELVQLRDVRAWWDAQSEDVGVKKYAVELMGG